MQPLMLAAVAAVVAAAVLELIGIALLVKRIAVTRRTRRVQGVVVATELYRSARGEVDHFLHRPTVRFDTLDGRTVEYQPRHYSNLAGYAVGQGVDVHYNPDRPDEVLIGSTRSPYYWISPIATIAAGAVLMAAAAVLWFVGGAVSG